MPSPTQLRGGRAEQRAVFFLRRHGYTIIAQHITSRFGEIDILAEKNLHHIIVEVKYRAAHEAWPIELSMSEKQVARLAMAYQAWCIKAQQQPSPNISYLWLLVSEETIRAIPIQ